MTDHNRLIAAIRDERESYQHGNPRMVFPLYVIIKSLEELSHIDDEAGIEAGAIEGLFNSMERLAVLEKRRNG